MFCQCYFNAQPASHAPGCGGMGPGCAMGAANGGATQRYCRFNNVFRVNSGHYGQTALDGAKFWLGGDLGADFSKGELDWSVVIFDAAVTKAQREGISAILAPLYPAKWKSLSVGPDAAIEWNTTGQRAEATLDGGKGGRVVLNRVAGMNDEPVVIKNLTFWGAPRNDGFILMTNEVEVLSAVPEGKKPFEFKGTNGFMITVDINSKDVQAAAKPKGAGY
jgi:hypothetical protein